jgi:hypothetical protein
MKKRAKVLAECKKALAGDSNDAEHDALQAALQLFNEHGRGGRKKHRLVMGTGYVWFLKAKPAHPGYTAVCLTEEAHGFGQTKQLKGTGELGGWQKIRLIAEW